MSLSNILMLYNNSDSFQNLWKVSTDTVENAEGALW